MLIGVNYPGAGGPIRERYINFSDSWDFGAPPPGWTRHWEQNLPEDLRLMKRRKFPPLGGFSSDLGPHLGPPFRAPQEHQNFRHQTSKTSFSSKGFAGATEGHFIVICGNLAYLDRKHAIESSQILSICYASFSASPSAKNHLGASTLCLCL